MEKEIKDTDINIEPDRFKDNISDSGEITGPNVRRSTRLQQMDRKEDSWEFGKEDSGEISINQPNIKEGDSGKTKEFGIEDSWEISRTQPNIKEGDSEKTKKHSRDQPPNSTGEIGENC